MADKLAAEAGQNDTGSLTSGKGAFHDINGDGLPDFVEQDGNGDLKVTLNTGSGFAAPEQLHKKSEISADLGSSVATYASTAYTIRIPLPFGFGINITPSIQGSHSESINRTTAALMDIDGDGLGLGLISCAFAIRPSVVLPIADRTTTTSLPFS